MDPVTGKKIRNPQKLFFIFESKSDLYKKEEIRKN